MPLQATLIPFSCNKFKTRRVDSSRLSWAVFKTNSGFPGLHRGGDACKLEDFSGTGLFIEALGIPFLAFLHGGVAEDLEKLAGWNQLSGEIAVGPVRVR